MAMFTDDMSIADARALLRTLVEDGHACPVCTQRAEIHTRPLNHASVRAVIAMLRVHGRDFGHLQTVAREHLADIAGQGGQLVLSQHWGLLEEERRLRPDGGRAGYWRVTERGEAFVHGRATVPSHARLYAGRFLRHVGEEVAAQDCLGKKFDLADLLGERAAADDSGVRVDRLFAVPDSAATSPYRPAVAA